MLWIDTETTGIDPTLHSMIEIAGIIDIDGSIKETFEFRCKPHPDFDINPRALLINELSEDIIWNFPDMKETHSALLKIFSKYIDKFNRNDKFIVCGQNIKFDIDILSHFFTRLGDPYLGSWIDFRKRIELYDITNCMRILEFIKSETVSLGPLCKEFGIPIQAHNALSDIKATRELYYTIVDNLEWKWGKNLEQPKKKNTAAAQKKLCT